MVKKRLICIIGPFPPPRHGMSAINEVVEALVSAKGHLVFRVDTAPKSLDRSLAVLFGRWPKIGRALVSIARLCGRESRVAIYLSVSGGWGALYDCGCLLVARLFRTQSITLHHHSFRYINQFYWPMWLLAACAGRRALHVVLCEKMGAQLQARYRLIERMMVLSNAGLINGLLPEHRSGVRPVNVLGYLSNLSAAKGLDDMLELAQACAQQRLPYEFVVAGPFESPETEPAYRERFIALGNIRFLGPVYGAEKMAFVARIDVFLFPTRYRHEAEPLVVLEALSHGRPVIAYDRGCISCLLMDGAGLVVPQGSSFTNAALNQLSAWRDAPQIFERAGHAARQRYENLVGESKKAAEDLVRTLGEIDEN